ncbi:hypothetical protein BUALT_Bualt02G0048200 [Buddleja alternifolia]|uniref:Beta-galactosidase n=1 Tax=Buddleja alternifolia TaxID=168488 RepID=A0AAV6Y5G7_9LAMI|nr:hypothetical protein BUALT_Bualt02G0048200 [Buddleja alternifolia]
MESRTSMLVFLLLVATTSFCFAVNVTYDGRALVIDGKRRVLVSGSIHYPRSSPEMWPDLIKKSKEGGLDIIETYVFWNLHERERGTYDFSGSANLPKFIKLVGEAGMYVHLRIGPYVCAEWNYGGFPLWLHARPAMEFRTDNEQFKAEVERFVAKIVQTLNGHKLFASQGGPIILAQIENEYGNVEKDYGPRAKTYIDWAAKMATSMDVKVPWVMCQQNNAPDPMINTCNGFYCDEFTPNTNKKPKIFTELWSGWFSSWGDPVPYRPAEDVAFSAARFYQLNGTLVNYYMYHGGTNFGHTSGGPFITTSYDYDAPIDEYGLLRQPKWGHLKDLHKAIKLSEAAMVATFGKTTSIGKNLEATVYETGSGLCAAFLANLDNQSDATVKFRGNSYDLPAWSVSILPDCKNVVYNTAKVNSIMTTTNFIRQPSINGTTATLSNWSWFKEPVGLSRNTSFMLYGLAEQINNTADRSDYLWYSYSTHLAPNDPMLKVGSHVKLHVDSRGHALYAFVNGKLVGSGKGRVSSNNFSIEVPVTFQPGNNTIDLLSMTVGLKNYGAFFDTAGAGINGAFLKSLALANGTKDLNNNFLQEWNYQIGVKGDEEDLSSGSSNLWVSKPVLPKNTVLTWYKTTFSAPPGNSPVAIDFTGMGKGEAWVNGDSIGRYWTSNVADSNASCVNSCDYRGQFGQGKCLKNCGKPTQQYYHVPHSWLDPTGNDLVVLEEIGGDPTKISIVTREIERICSVVSETHPLPLDMPTANHLTRKIKPTLTLECPSPKQVISEIHFVDFGTPLGTLAQENQDAVLKFQWRIWVTLVQMLQRV